MRICAPLNLVQFKAVDRIHSTKTKFKKLSLTEDDSCYTFSLSPEDQIHTFLHILNCIHFGHLFLIHCQRPLYFSLHLCYHW